MSAPQSPADAKRLSTLIARAALVGVIVNRIEGDFVPELFVATKWALTREFTDIGAVEAWLDRVTGKAA